MREGVFNDFCETDARKRKSILRPAAMEKLREVQQEGHTVVVVSANMDSWVRLFLPGIEVIGTKVEVMNERLTGRFYTRNCYGKEKVRRFLERFPERNTYELIVYGDSRGDHELLDIADEGYYKPFRK
jgi:HAD superfamily phosphoserine phosphatase-like hydrolase